MPRNAGICRELPTARIQDPSTGRGFRRLGRHRRSAPPNTTAAGFDDNGPVHKAWEKALQKASRTAEAVMRERAVCLYDMELKIRAWAFTAAVEKGETLSDLNSWRPHAYQRESYFIASLRDDVRHIWDLVAGATFAVSSIGAEAPMPEMPKAPAYSTTDDRRAV
jgi:hypothetical protein